MEKYFYFVVKPDGAFEQVEIKDSRVPELEDLQKAVGGYIEVVSGPLFPIVAIVNEEGRLKGLEDNPFGTMAIRYPEPLCGNVVIAAVDGEDIVGLNEELTHLMRRSINQVVVLFGSFFNSNGGGTIK